MTKEAPYRFASALRNLKGDRLKAEWKDYPRQKPGRQSDKTSVFPIVGTGFVRHVDEHGVVWHRYLEAHDVHGTDLHVPPPNCRPDGRFVLFERSLLGPKWYKIFDFVAEDGSLIDLEQYPLAFLFYMLEQRRDLKVSEMEKAVEENQDAPKKKAGKEVEEGLRGPVSELANAISRSQDLGKNYSKPYLRDAGK